MLVRAEVKGDESKGNQTMIAEVLKVGPLAEAFTVGDRVAFSPYGFDEVMVGEEKLIVINDTMILGIYEKQTENTPTTA